MLVFGMLYDMVKHNLKLTFVRPKFFLPCKTSCFFYFLYQTGYISCSYDSKPIKMQIHNIHKKNCKHMLSIELFLPMAKCRHFCFNVLFIQQIFLVFQMQVQPMRSQKLLKSSLWHHVNHLQQRNQTAHRIRQETPILSRVHQLLHFPQKMNPWQWFLSQFLLLWCQHQTDLQEWVSWRGVCLTLM